MRFYLISDTHFSHTNIIEYCNRPFKDINHMNRTMINNWNSVVKGDDIVVHLGDVCLGNKDDARKVLSQLNGRKILIRGNHDRWSDEFYKECGFEYISRYPIIWQDKYILSHAPLQYDAGEYINIFGHVHNRVEGLEKLHKSKCVCVEKINYTPIEFSRLTKIIKGEIKDEY